MTVRVMIENGSYAENEAELSCVTCSATFLTSRDDAIDAEKLVGVLQVHMANCPGEPEKSENLFHRQCGTQLIHFRGEPNLHRCALCNRTISPAEQIEHVMSWINYASFYFQPECSCGWASTHGHMLEKDATAEWRLHPKAEPRKLRAVTDEDYRRVK